MDSVSTSRQEAESLPHNQPQKIPQHQVAGQEPGNRGPLLKQAYPASTPSLCSLRCDEQAMYLASHRLPKSLFYDELQEFKSSQGGQKKRFKDNLKISMKAFAINPNTWDRAEWGSSLCTGQ